MLLEQEIQPVKGTIGFNTPLFRCEANDFDKLSLLNGTTGQLFQLLELYVKTGEKDLLLFINQKNELLTALTEDSTSWNISLGTGKGGLLLLNLRLFELTNNPQLLKNVLRLLDKFLSKNLIALNNEHSFYQGLSGLLYVLIKIQEYCRENIVSKTIVSIVDRLFEKLQVNERGIFFNSSVPHQNIFGFGYGNAGIAFTLIELAKHSENAIFYKIADQLLVCEERFLQQRIKATDWKKRSKQELNSNLISAYLEFAFVCYHYYSCTSDDYYAKTCTGAVQSIKSLLYITFKASKHKFSREAYLRLPNSEIKKEANDLRRELTTLEEILCELHTAQFIKKGENHILPPSFWIQPGKSHTLNCTFNDYYKGSILGIDRKLYHEILVRKNFDSTLNACYQIDKTATENFLNKDHVNLHCDFIDFTNETFLPNRSFESFKNIFHLEKIKCEWRFSTNESSSDEETILASSLADYFNNSERNNISLTFSKDILFVDLEGYTNIFDIDPADRISLARIFTTYGKGSWLLRKYAHNRVNEINLFFYRILIDQFFIACSVFSAVTKLGDYIACLNEKSIKLVKTIFLYKQDAPFDIFFRKIMTDFVIDLICNGFLVPECQHANTRSFPND